MAETLRQRMVRNYSYAIYIDGIRKFADVNEGYHAEIKQYAATNFSDDKISSALANGWITQQEYEDTMALRTESSPISSEKL
jgi:hypothetical protein